MVNFFSLFRKIVHSLVNHLAGLRSPILASPLPLELPTIDENRFLKQEEAKKLRSTVRFLIFKLIFQRLGLEDKLLLFFVLFY